MSASRGSPTSSQPSGTSSYYSIYSTSQNRPTCSTDGANGTDRGTNNPTAATTSRVRWGDSTREGFKPLTATPAKRPTVQWGASTQGGFKSTTAGENSTRCERERQSIITAQPDCAGSAHDTDTISNQQGTNANRSMASSCPAALRTDRNTDQNTNTINTNTPTARSYLSQFTKFLPTNESIARYLPTANQLTEASHACRSRLTSCLPTQDTIARYLPTADQLTKAPGSCVSRLTSYVPSRSSIVSRIPTLAQLTEAPRSYLSGLASHTKASIASCLPTKSQVATALGATLVLGAFSLLAYKGAVDTIGAMKQDPLGRLALGTARLAGSTGASAVGWGARAGISGGELGSFYRCE